MAEPGEEADAEMMQAMGFSAFGVDTTTKRKRKFDDDLVSDASQAREAQKNSRGTGANNSKLGVRPGAKMGAGLEQLDNVTSTLNNTNIKGKGKNKAPDLQGGGLAAFLSHGKTLPHPAPTATARGDEGQKEKVPPQDDSSAPQHTLHDYRRGVRNAQGDMAYFLPSFLEDPWKDLT